MNEAIEKAIEKAITKLASRINNGSTGTEALHITQSVLNLAQAQAILDNLNREDNDWII